MEMSAIVRIKIINDDGHKYFMEFPISTAVVKELISQADKVRFTTHTKGVASFHAAAGFAAEQLKRL